tara:strand:- start:147 stop:395 length:249 start_codon:yes stop_codon:yes gene_type:complete
LEVVEPEVQLEKTQDLGVVIQLFQQLQVQVVEQDQLLVQYHPLQQGVPVVVELVIKQLEQEILLQQVHLKVILVELELTVKV